MKRFAICKHCSFLQIYLCQCVLQEKTEPPKKRPRLLQQPKREKPEVDLLQALTEAAAAHVP